MFRYAHTVIARTVLAVLVLAMASCSNESAPAGDAEPGPAKSTKTVLELALTGIGGREALAGLQGFSEQSTREVYLMGQGPQAGRGLMKQPRREVTVSNDLSRGNIRVDISDRYAARGGGYESRDSVELIVGQAGYLSTVDIMGIVADKDTPLSPERVVARIKTERLLNPHLLLRQLLADPARGSLGNDTAPTSGWRFTAEEVLPVTLDRGRQTGRRTLVVSQDWLTRNEGTKFFEDMVEKVEVDGDWLKRWHTATSLTGSHERLVIQDEVYPITLHIDPATGRIDKATTLEWDVVYGDVALEAAYSDWQTVDGVSFPNRVRLSVGGAPRMDVQRSQVTVNPSFDTDAFEAPAGITYVHDEARAQRGRKVSQSLAPFGFAGVGRPELGTVEVAPGVTMLYALPLDGVFTLVVEQEAGLVLMEPGQNDLKGEVIIDWAKQNHPQKPITHIIVSHHHNDHAAGIRPYVAAGVTVVAHAAATDFFAAQTARPVSKVVVDALDRNPTPAKIVGVPAGKPYRIEDPDRPVVVYPVVNAHVDDLVFTLVEAEKVLYSGDMYIGGLARDLRAGRTRPDDILPYHSAVSLIKAIEKYELGEPTLISSHDRDPVTYAELVTYVTGE